MKSLLRNIFLVSILVLIASCNYGSGDSTSSDTRTTGDDWEAILAEAQDQRVYWHAWGGSPVINAYIEWVADQVKDEYDITLEHVKITDTGNSVSQVLAEKASGKNTGGSVDLIWINGENFKAMKENDLLFGPFANQLPNFEFVDVENKPTTVVDFTVPTDGYESPWGMAQLNFIYDSSRVAIPPGSLEELLVYAMQNPGRFAYPAVPDFMGSTFLKQVLYETMEDTSILQEPVNDLIFAENILGLQDFLDRMRPHLWQRGVNYPQDTTMLERLLADNEIDFALTFNPGHASEAIQDGRLPPSVRSFVMDGGSIGNTHFVAIPYNSDVSAAAQVVANFLISPEAQAHKGDPNVWGDPTVLNVEALDAADKQLFDAIDLGPASLSPEELGRVLPEPHPSWMEKVEEFWLDRYRG